jgi:ribonuclease P protein component
MISLRYLPGDAFLYSPVVSKKQGTAAVRNRIKRIIREVMRAGKGTYPPGSYLVYYNGTSAQLDRNEISANIRNHMETIQYRNSR